MIGFIDNKVFTSSVTELGMNSLLDDETKRIESEDLKKAIDLLYDFKKNLNTLHPNVIHIMERMLRC